MPSNPNAIRIGDDYQAVLPMLNDLSIQTANKLDTNGNTIATKTKSSMTAIQKWDARGCKEENVLEFIERSCRLHEKEMGLECFFAAKFIPSIAENLLHKARQTKIKKQYQLDSILVEDQYEIAMQEHGKRFAKVKDALDGSTVNDVVAKYYNWKITDGYKKWRSHYKGKRRRRNRSRKKSQGAMRDCELLIDYHNDQCEYCSTTGNLLCCDGCERAFHLCCLNPPLHRVPHGSWFCSNCLEIIQQDQQIAVPSIENKYCNIIVSKGLSIESSKDPHKEMHAPSSLENQEATPDSLSKHCGESIAYASEVYQEGNTSNKNAAEKESASNDSHSTDHEATDSLSIITQKRKHDEVDVKKPIESKVLRAISHEKRTTRTATPPINRKRHRKITQPKRIPPDENSVTG